MSSYNILSKVYDNLTDNVEYEARSNYISGFFHSYCTVCKNVLDLACGSGTMTVLLAKKGFNMTGVDFSEDMLAEAYSKAVENDLKIQFVQQDMRELNLLSKMDAVVCCLDSINHLLSVEDVEKVFKNVSSCLEENGLFVFDVNTVYKHQEILKDNSFVFETENSFLVWQNELCEDGRTVNLYIDLFCSEDGIKYFRESEDFSEKAYTIEELSNALEKSDFEIIGIYDDLSLDKPKEDSDRLYFVCKKRG